MHNFILKIATKDSKGLIYKISKLIYEYDLNIIQNNEFVGGGEFFFRAVLEGHCDEKSFLNKLYEVLGANTKANLYERKKKDIIILATKETHCLGELLLKHYSKELFANIKAVISNYDELGVLVEKFNIPYHFLASENLSREAHEAKVLECLAGYELDYIVLAKYMRILTPEFVRHYENKIINIHHSFLPAFIGANPYKQAFERGVKIIGATAHFVNNALDEGPIIAQDILPINHEFTWQDMKKAGQNVEKFVLLKALDLVFEEKVFLQGNKTIVF